MDGGRFLYIYELYMKQRMYLANVRMVFWLLVIIKNLLAIDCFLLFIFAIELCAMPLSMDTDTDTDGEPDETLLFGQMCYFLNLLLQQSTPGWHGTTKNAKEWKQEYGWRRHSAHVSNQTETSAQNIFSLWTWLLNCFPLRINHFSGVYQYPRKMYTLHFAFAFVVFHTHGYSAKVQLLNRSSFSHFCLVSHQPFWWYVPYTCCTQCNIFEANTIFCGFCYLSRFFFLPSQNLWLRSYSLVTNNI